MTGCPEEFKRLALLHDALFNHVFEDDEVFKEFVNIVFSNALGRRVEEILVPGVQKKVDCITGHSIIVDAFCKLDDGTIISIEAQNSNNTAHPRRIRYYHAVMTVSETPKGVDYKDIPDVCTIYITNFDYFRQNSAYCIPAAGLLLPNGEFIIPDEELKRKLDDGSNVIYINAKADDDTPIGRLVKVLANLSVFDEELCPKLTAKKDEFLRKDGFIMREYMGDFARENYDRGYDKGKEEDRQEIEQLRRQNAEMSVLGVRLIDEKRFSDLARAFKDLAYRALLIKEIFPEGIPVAQG